MTCHRWSDDLCPSIPRRRRVHCAVANEWCLEILGSPQMQDNNSSAPGSNPGVHHSDRPPGDDSVDLLTQTQSLRRKVIFWRRMVGLVFGLGAVILVVVWNRGETRRRECRVALKEFGALAEREKLAEQDPGILENQWQQLPPADNGISAAHYDLIVHNWIAKLLPAEELPLAVCRDSHMSTFERGRHVLLNTPGGYNVVWMEERLAAKLAAEARKDDFPK